MRAVDIDELNNKIDRYINAESVWDKTNWQVASDLREIIDGMPVINTVKNGKWLGMQRCNMDGDLTYCANCSVCGVEVVLWEHNSFCPCCGAKMEV